MLQVPCKPYKENSALNWRLRCLKPCCKPWQAVVEALRKDQRQGAKGQAWRGAYRRIQEQLLDLEKDSIALELVFPQARSHTSLLPPCPACLGMLQ